VLSIVVNAIPFILGVILLLSLINVYTNFRRARRAPYFRVRRNAAGVAWRWLLIGMAAGGGIAASIAARQYVPSAGSIRLPELPAVPTATPTIDIMLSSATPAEGVPTKDIFAVPPTITPTQPTPTATQTPFIVTIESQVTPPADTTIAITAISSGISASLQPINANTQFPVSMPRFYIWLEYDNMADGVSWSRVLIRNGGVLRSESEAWDRAEKGVVYYYFDAPNGWPAGSYEVQIYIGDKVAASQKFEIID